MDLPGAVMRGALAVVALALLLGLLLGLWRARADMGDELAGAIALARSSALLASAHELDDAALIAALRASLERAPASGDSAPREGSRHLTLRLVDAQGRVRLALADPVPRDDGLAALAALADRLFPPPPDRSVRIALPRPDGSTWQAQWTASHDYEQREASAQLIESMLLLAGCSGLLLLVMRWRMQRAFRPLAPLLAAIERVERHDRRALRALPTMPVRELEAIAGALRHLGGALDEAEAQRRQLAAQVHTLQEDERSRLARELHDELGQHLTALRVDAAWLERRLADEPELRAVVAGMSEQCGRVQAEVRALLGRLRPLGEAGLLGSAPSGGAPAFESAERLRGLLEALVAAWAQSPGQSTRFELRFELDDAVAKLPLPRELVLCVYRISQEALTNVARHAQAREARLAVRIAGAAGEGGAARIAWQVEDDGRGFDGARAGPRGNGLAGIRERIWAAGGDLVIEPCRAGRLDAGHWPGLRLRATLAIPVPARGALESPSPAAACAAPTTTTTTTTSTS
ncbi:MAG TPA: histidine kinase [Methylibium sp.]|uniref:histidine kinase n=1 Tax=Methylibium sp. TaxID=2067992 RepID=UPI002DBFF231|nr:histidine kinase [Methylibium sp.]HEU4459814.1 histidine kinase [Methylibium sp.]